MRICKNEHHYREVGSWNNTMGRSRIGNQESVDEGLLEGRYGRISCVWSDAGGINEGCANVQIVAPIILQYKRVSWSLCAGDCSLKQGRFVDRWKITEGDIKFRGHYGESRRRVWINSDDFWNNRIRLKGSNGEHDQFDSIEESTSNTVPFDSYHSDFKGGWIHERDWEVK